MSKILYLWRLSRWLGFFGCLKYLADRYIRKCDTIGVLLKGATSPLKLRNNTSDLIVFHQVFAWDDLFTPPDLTPKVLLDLGAYTGISTLFLALKYPDALVIAVEPAETNFAMLEANSKAVKNVRAFNWAVTAERTQVEIENPDAIAFSFTVKESSAENSVLGLPMNDIPSEAGVTHVDFVKMDIEGAENSAFDSYPWNWATTLQCLIAETHDDIVPGVTAMITDKMANDFSMSDSGEYLVFQRKRHPASGNSNETDSAPIVMD